MRQTECFFGLERPFYSEGRRTLSRRARTVAWANQARICKAGPVSMKEARMSQEPIYVGLDVSKERIDIAARPTGTSWSVSYDSDGVDDLVAQLKELSPAGVSQSLPAAWNLTLAAALAAASLPVAVVNPRQVRDCRQVSWLRQTRWTSILAHFGEAVRPACGPYGTPTRRRSGRYWRAGGGDDPCCGEEPPQPSRSGGTSQHTYRLAA